jgi:AMMECR1 domain-containing protein
MPKATKKHIKHQQHKQLPYSAIQIAWQCLCMRTGITSQKTKQKNKKTKKNRELRGNVGVCGPASPHKNKTKQKTNNNRELRGNVGVCRPASPPAAHGKG